MLSGKIVVFLFNDDILTFDEISNFSPLLKLANTIGENLCETIKISFGSSILIETISNSLNSALISLASLTSTDRSADVFLRFSKIFLASNSSESIVF